MSMCTSASEVALYINKSQGMALSAGANITGLNHTLQQLITLYTCKLEIPGKVKYPKQRFKLFILITGIEQHENANCWYSTEQYDNTA